MERQSSRNDVLALLGGANIGRVPCLSGLINITSAGLQALGLRFHEIHRDPGRMAAAAMTSYRLFGFESAVVPTDLCVEAGALGAEVDFRDDVDEPMFPIVPTPLFASAADFRLDIPHNLIHHPRVECVLEAIQLLKAEAGNEVALGAWVPGPFTLAAQLVELGTLYTDVKESPQEVARMLKTLTNVLIAVARAYHSAGADFLTVHEMGGSPGVIGPAAFQELVLPHLQTLMAALPAPRVLSVCGNTNQAMELLEQAGAEAISVDQTNDLAHSRRRLESQRLFGNIDPVKVLDEGDEAAVRRAVRSAVQAGVDAIWPGCDLPPSVPIENVRAMVKETRR